MAKATNADVKNNELSAEELAQQYTGALVEKALEAEREAKAAEAQEAPAEEVVESADTEVLANDAE